MLTYSFFFFRSFCLWFFFRSFCLWFFFRSFCLWFFFRSFCLWFFFRSFCLLLFLRFLYLNFAIISTVNFDKFLQILYFLLIASVFADLFLFVVNQLLLVLGYVFLAELSRSDLIGTPDLSLPPVILIFPSNPTREASVS